MSGAEQTEADEANDGEAQEETEADIPEQNDGPTFYERVQQVIDDKRISEVRDMDPDERSEVEAEALEVKDLENEYDVGIDELDDTQATHDELDRLYNEEGLSLIDIGRLFRTTDATVQRRMEQHGLERRGSRNEIPQDQLMEAFVDLACEMSEADDADELAELVEAGEATVPTTTAMGEQGPHSAHTYYNYWDGWGAVKEAFYDHIGAEPPADDESEGDEAEEEASDAEDEDSEE